MRAPKPALVPALLLALVLGLAPGLELGLKLGLKLGLELDLPLGRLASCQAAEPPATRDIPLAGPAAAAEQEFSGLAWLGEDLLLLPQYPARSGGVYLLDKQEILDVLLGARTEPLAPRLLPFDDGGLSRTLQGFEGFEAIAIQEKPDGEPGEGTVWCLAEARWRKTMIGWLIRGKAGPSGVRLEPATAIRLEPPVQLRNMAFEALFIKDDVLHVLFEANGQAVNPAPQALRFSSRGESLPPLPMPSLEFRVTDAVLSPDGGEAWLMNFFWHGEAALLQPRPEPGSVADEDPSAGGARDVERLAVLRFSGKGLELTGPPLVLPGGLLPSNWEGLAWLDATRGPTRTRGLLRVTDKYPTTRLGFIALP